MRSSAVRKTAPAARKTASSIEVQAPATPAVQASASDRFWLGAMAVLMVGIAARQLLLGPAPFHPDEAIHAFFAQGFGSYHYDPVYHGPLLYHLVAGVFRLFGEYDFTARLVPSVLGIGLLALILFPMRRFASNRAAISGAALVAISPSIVTYSRHLLHDSLVLFLTMGAVLCFLLALDCGAATHRGRGARLGLAAFLSLFLATKANFFFILVMLLAFWIAWRLGGWLRLPAIARRVVPALCFVVVTASAIWFSGYDPATAKILPREHRAFQIIAVAACGTLWLWLMSRRASDEKRDDVAPEKRKAKGEKPPRDGQLRSSTRRSDVLLTYFLAAFVALAIYLFLFGQGAQVLAQWSETHRFPADTFAAGAGGARTAIKQMWDYWGGQQANPRLPGRHDYYVVLALLYEVPILVAGMGGVWHASRNRSVFTDLLLWWSFTSWAVYAVANEKVPWLLVHICLPLALLGGVWLAQVRLPRWAWGAGLVLGAFFSLRSDYAMIFGRAGDNAEPILYAQSPDAFRDAAETALAETRGDVRPTWINNDGKSGKDRQWPTVWYFREGAPDIGISKTSLGNALITDDTRVAVTTPDDLPNVGAMTRAGWQTKTVDFLIWTRASWTALEPRRYWRWFWTRDTFPLDERRKPQSQWKTSILAGKGEWSSVQAIVGWRKN